MIRAERHERILAELARRGTVSAQYLAQALDASLATIRRDIAELEERRALSRTHGGASLASGREELPYDLKALSFLPEKRRIAAEAAGRIADGSVVGCGGGTTVLQMLPTLRRKAIKVVTTAVNVALELREAPDVEITLTGGVLRQRTAETVGHIAERTLRDINIDVTIIGVDGLDIDGGLTTFDASEAYVNRVMLQQSRALWVIADHSKLGRVLPAIIAPATAASRIVTDTGASDGDCRSAPGGGDRGRARVTGRCRRRGPQWRRNRSDSRRGRSARLRHRALFGYERRERRSSGRQRRRCGWRQKCIIFDLDGVPRRQRAAELGCAPRRARRGGRRRVGRRGAQRYLSGEAFPPSRQRCGVGPGRCATNFEARYRARIFAAFEAGLRPTPGLGEVLARLAVRARVATSSTPARATRTLEIIGLWGRFGGCLDTASEVSCGKPAPDLFLLSAARAGGGSG